MRKTICSILAALAISLPAYAADKSDVSKYEYKGKIGTEQVTFTRYGGCKLEVVSDKNVRQIFDDKDCNLKIEKFSLHENFENLYYPANEYPLIIVKAQKAFDSYLPKLEKAKKAYEARKVRKALDLLE